MSEIKITDDCTVIIPRRSAVFGVEKKDWERIKRLIQELQLKSSFWENAAWFSLAGVLSFFITFFSVDKENEYRIVFLTAGICFILVTVMFFIFNHISGKTSKNGKDNILKEMIDMEKLPIDNPQDTTVR